MIPDPPTIRDIYRAALQGFRRDEDHVPDEAEAAFVASCEAKPVPDLDRLGTILSQFLPPENAAGMEDLLEVAEGIVRHRRHDPEVLKFLRREREWIAARLRDTAGTEGGGLPRLDNELEALNRAICTATYRTADDPILLRRALAKLCATDRHENGTVLDGIHEKLTGILQATGRDEVVTYLSEWADDLTNRVETARSALEGEAGSPEGHIAEFRRLQELARRFRSPRLAQKIKPLAKRLRREQREARLSQRLDRILRPRGVRFLNNTIMLLVIFIAVMLLWQLRFPPDPQTAFVFLCIDVGICFFLLGDFFFRLFLAGPWYFPSHALLEFVPALPYPLLFPAHASYLEFMPSIRFLALLRAGSRAALILRPLIRSFRLFAFLMGGLDRLAEQLRPLLDQEIKLGWENEETERDEKAPAADPLLELQARYSYRIRVNLRHLPPEEARAFLFGYTASLVLLTDVVRRAAPSLQPTADLTTKHTLTLGRLVDRLKSLDPIRVEVELGSHATRGIAVALRYMNMFPLRYLPAINPLARASRLRDPADATCQAGAALARTLERPHNLLQVFADFRGVGTGPQILDRFASMVVSTAKRYAWRLLSVGLTFLLATGLVQLSGISSLEPLAVGLRRLLGIPMILLGVLSGGVLLFGLYLKRLAGEALDTWRNTAEAQFINLGKSEKSRFDAENRAFLEKRVLHEERRLALPERQGSIARLKQKVEYLYQDWLDGAILHESDVKLAEQLLGNVAVQQLRGFCLRESARERRRRERRSLARRSGFLPQPEFYFRLMADTLSVEAAKLIVEYNRYAVPTGEVPALTPGEQARYTQWLEQGAVGRRRRSHLPWHTEFHTTFFTARHILCPDPQVLQEVEGEFGAAVARRLREDRRNLIRELFGQWPLRIGAINPYVLYQRYVRSYRVFLLPARYLWWIVRLLLLGLRRALVIIREIRGELPETEVQRNVPASFAVARRKIARMRQALLEEATELRALVDPEYLGVNPPALPPRADTPPLRDDLPFLPDPAIEEHLDRRHRRAHDDAIRFRKYLLKAGWSGRESEHAAELLAGRPIHGASETLRACFLAYALNWRGVKVKLDAEDLLKEFFGRLRRRVVRTPRLLTRLKEGLILGAAFFSRRHRMHRSLYRRLGQYISERELRARLLLPFLSGPYHIHQAAFVATRPPEQRETIRREGIEALQCVARRSSFWSEQVVTIRTLQSLAVLDIMRYVRLVWELGEYNADIAVDPPPG